MPKSPLSKGSVKVNHVRNSKNIVSLNFIIPYKKTSKQALQTYDVSHLLYLGADKSNKKVNSRTPYIRSFCKMANKYVENGKSADSVTTRYESLYNFICFCDAVKVDPFTEDGYLKIAGNDGELRHRIKVYNPSKKIWAREDGEELGTKESAAASFLSALRKALEWCGLPAEQWKVHHRGFTGEKTPIKGYSDQEEDTLVTRLSELFFSLAPQLIAAKENKASLPETLHVTIDLGGYKEVLSIDTSLQTNFINNNSKASTIKIDTAFNLAMGAAYHLICFFTSLNDRNVRDIAHPIIVHTKERDKAIKTVNVSSFKARSNKVVDSTLTSETDESLVNFDVDKRDGVTFIQTLEQLSKLYCKGSEGKPLLFTLNSKGEDSQSLGMTQINQHLTSKLNLVSPYRGSCLRWFKEKFYAYLNYQNIKLGRTKDSLGRVIVKKTTAPVNEEKRTLGVSNTSYCILSCYTNLPLKEITLPLVYSKKNKDGNIIVSFQYLSGDVGSFTIPAADLKLVQDIEQFAVERADKQTVKKNIRLLLKKGGDKEAPKSWSGISPISSNLMREWSIEAGEYFISLTSSRWREMTSSQEYDDEDVSRVQSILQNTIATIDKHYANGDPNLNKTFLSQGVQVLELIAKGSALDEAKEEFAAKHVIPMLAYDEYLKLKSKNNAHSNPNGIVCNGKQDIDGGKNTQKDTNRAMGAELPCTEYDMCYKCKSAKAVNGVEEVYKLISFIEALKGVLDQFPNAKDEVIEKIDSFQFTLDGASSSIFESAMDLFKKNGPHPRVSRDHAVLSIKNPLGDL